MAALSPPEEVEIQNEEVMADPKVRDGDIEEKEVWDITELHRYSERDLSALDHVKSFSRESFSLPVPTTVVEAQK